ncbi:uncharacterized protein [Amphiura filiformis]|uniref:uncharacterized protein n=1 Tax=Amphiura filiformis TaxID=82378 RepID=UPI003B213479
MADTKPTRIILWAVPRTTSTALAKCMSFVAGCQVIDEPYTAAYHIGPERVKLQPQLEQFVGPIMQSQFEQMKAIPLEADLAYDHDVCTYEWVKGQLEADYPGHSVVFCKEMAYGLQGKYDMIPQGYRHVFLIRHPHKVFPSWRKMLAESASRLTGNENFRMCDLPPFLLPSKYGYEEQYELFQYIKANIDPSPIVIDSDDLLSNPKSILSQYCQAVNIPFHESLLHWPDDEGVVKRWKASRRFLLANLMQKSDGFYATALKSSAFTAPSAVPPITSLPDGIVPCVEASMPFYLKMHELRIKP